MNVQDKIQIFKKELAEKSELYLRVKARPGAVKTEIKDVMEDETVKIDIAAPPEKGKANQALIAYLAKYFNAGAVKVISGAGERIKLIKMIK